MAVAAPIMLAATLASTALGVVSSIQQGKAQAQAHKYNAAVAQNEAIAARQAAAFEADRVRQRRDKVLSSQRAAFGKSGLALEGSPLALMEDTAAEAELDALVVQHQGSVMAARAESQAALDRMQAKQARTAGYFGAGASVLRGVSSLAGMYGGGGGTSSGPVRTGYTSGVAGGRGMMVGGV